MIKIFVASTNRSEFFLLKLIDKMKQNNLYTDNVEEADYIFISGDRIESFYYAAEKYIKNKKIIQYAAGEISQGCHDEVFRHSITLMSCLQLCANPQALDRVKRLCESVDKEFNGYVVGNLLLDNLEIDEGLVPTVPYDLILYNPPTLLTTGEMAKEIDDVKSLIHHAYIWVEPNGDTGSDIIKDLYVTHRNVPRPQFLGLIKNCERFITNSSCQYFEAPFLMDKDRIVSIGVRNKNRESKYSDMSILNASDNVIKILKELK